MGRPLLGASDDRRSRTESTYSVQALPAGNMGTFRRGFVPSGQQPYTSAKVNILRIAPNVRSASAGLWAFFYIIDATAGRFS